jgi:hypothetical protein
MGKFILINGGREGNKEGARSESDQRFCRLCAE